MQKLLLTALCAVTMLYAQTVQPGGNGGGGSSASADNPAFNLAFTAGGGSEASATNYVVKAASGITLDKAWMSLVTAPSVSSLIIDIFYLSSPYTSGAACGTGAGWASVFGATKLVWTTATVTPGTISQATFSASPLLLPQGTIICAKVTQNDSGLTAQGAYVSLAVH